MAAFLVAEPADDEPAPVHETGVGGEDEIGQAGDRLHLPCPGAGGLEIGHHVVPLPVGEIDVDPDLLVHPGVDLVEHPEVARRADQIFVTPGEGDGPDGISHG